MPLAVVISLLVVAQLALSLLCGRVVPWSWQEYAFRVFWLAFLSTLCFAYLAARKLPELGAARPRFSPGVSMGWFLCPIGNLFMPHQVLSALWRESQPQPSLDVRRGWDFSVRLVTAWWALCASIMVVGTLRVDLHVVRSLELLRVASGACFIAVVLGIARRQREQWLDLERRRAVPRPLASALR
jgi:hypothetical protein